MSDYPVVLTGLDTRRCVVVGGGAVAARKVKALVEAGARPTVISPELCQEMEQAVETGSVETIRRRYREGDLEGAGLVIAATDDEAVNREIAEECRRKGILLNVVDRPPLCTFTAPSVIRRGELLVTISTGGASPAFAKHVREILESVLDSAYGDALAILAELRPRIQQDVPASKQGALWNRLLDGEVMACLRSEGVDAARALAAQMVCDFCRAPESKDTN